jgi:hypothetical protein
MSTEPLNLTAGKAFHRRVQSDWKRTAQGNITPEHTIRLSIPQHGSRHHQQGRLDIFVGQIDDFVTVVEIKGTQWDSIKPQNVSKNLNSHARQVWRYVETVLDVDKVCAGVIYPRGPTDPFLRERIETYLNERGLQVVWYDE